MDIDVMGRTYNIYGGHPTISWGGQFLLQGIPDFGSAIREIEITFHFPHAEPALKSRTCRRSITIPFQREGSGLGSPKALRTPASVIAACMG